MKVEYVDSAIGIGQDLVIEGKEYASAKDKATFDMNSLMYILRSYQTYANIPGNLRIRSRDIEEAFRWCGKSGYIRLVTIHCYSEEDEFNICKVYAEKNRKTVLVVDINEQGKEVNLSPQTLEETRKRKENEET